MFLRLILCELHLYFDVICSKPKGPSMSTIDPSTFTVDIPSRTVTHTSGVEVAFDRFYSEADWLQDDCATMRNPLLYEGNSGELAAAAKQAAINGGMKHQ